MKASTSGFTVVEYDNGSNGTRSSGSSESGWSSEVGTLTIETGNGNDTVSSSAENPTIVFGSGTDTLTQAGAGSVVEAGTGTDYFNLSNDVEIVGAEAQDVLEWAGQVLHGATEWASAQGGWAVNALTDVEYGIDTLGELEVKNILGQVMTLTDYTGGPGAAYDTAGIYLAVLSMAAYRLLDPNKPNVDFIESQLSLANAEYKADTGKPLFQGMDPLVLDLTGNGLDLIGESEQSPLFDAYGDEFAVHTGWVKPDDGFLVWDDNGTYELFGAPGSSGFAALAAEDSNGDGVLNAEDSIFSQLYVWQDVNGNAVIDPGELTSLTQLGIASINTSGTAQTDDIVNGNYVTETGTFTYTNGSTSTIGDVSFATDNFHTQYTGDTTISAAAAALPNLKGYGTLTDLQVAMTIDPALITTVTNTLSTASMDVVDLDTLRNTAMTIFSAWAAAVPLSDTALAPGGHSDVPILLTTNGSQVTVTDYAYEVTNANGTYWVLASGHQVLDANGNVIPYPTLDQIYAQTSSTGSWTTITGAELDFAERYLGDGITINDNPADASQTLSVLGPELTAAWNALNLETVRLAMQGPLAPYFAGLSYDTASDTFDVTTNEQLAPMFTAIFAGAPTTAAGATAWIAAWRPILDVIEGNLAPSQGLTATYGYLFASMVAGYEATSMPISIASVAVALGIPSDLIYDAGTTLQAANADANILYAAGGNQTIIGSGGPDNDIFGSNFGNDVINNQNTNQDPDILWFATLDPADITASRNGVDLILTDNATGAQISVLNEFVGIKPDLFGNNLNPVTGDSQIVFADGTVWNAPDIAYQAGLNTRGVDGTLLGTPSNDVLDGDNGNTFMSGGDGGDIYLYDRGDGQDTIADKQTNILITAPDVVVFGPGLAPSDVTFTRNGDSDNLVIVVNGDPSDSLTILGQFDSTFTGVFGTANFDQIEGFQFADGTQYSSSQVELMVLAAEEAIPNNTIYGFDGADIIDPGVGGNDFMSGGNGDDTYIFGMGYGNDTILEGMQNILSGTDDTVLFNADISPSDVTFSRSGNSANLTVTVNGDTADSLTILDQFDSTFTGVFGTINFNEIESFAFANGVTYSATQIEQLVIAAAEAIPNNTIYGFDGNDLIDPGVGGNDYMSGGNGDDTYVFGLGYGHDTIYDGEGNILSGTDDTVLFNAGINPSNVSVVRNGGSNDFTLVLSDGSSLAILDQFYNIWAGPFGDIQFDQIENFEFQDAANTDWTAANIEQMAISAQAAVPGGAIYGFWNGAYIDPGTGGGHLMAGEGGSNTYAFGLGYGDDTIDDSGGGEVLFNADVNPADVTFLRGASDDLTIMLADGSELDIKDQFSFVPYGLGDVLPNQVATFQFQDAAGTELTNAQIEQRFITSEGQQAGGTVYSYYGGDTLSGAGGNETLIGVNGANTFLFGLGYGHETIALSDDGYFWAERATGVVSFGQGILPSAITLVTSSSTGVLQVDIAGAQDTLNIENYAALLSPGFAGASLTGFQFSNGTVWSATEITTILETDALNGELPTKGSTLTGPFPNNYVDPGVAGNHDMVSTGGDNTYVFGLGYGDDTIQDSSEGGSEVLFNSNVSPSAVQFSRGGTNFWDLTITLADGSQLDISNEFLPTPYGFGDSIFNDVGYFKFQDASNTELTYAQVESDLIASEEAHSNGTIYSFYGGDTLDGASGNDTFVGVNGANTILFGIGDGNEYLSLHDDDYYYAQRATANIVFGAGIDADSISLVTDGSSGALTIRVNGTLDSLTVANYASLLGGSDLSFQFADGTVWNSAKITNVLETASLDAQLAVFGGPLNGPFPDNYVDPGLGGNHNIISAGGNNTYVFGYGYGDDTIHDTSGGGSELLFGPGVTPSTVQFTRGGPNFWDLTITLADGSQLDISNEFLPTAYGFGASIENDVGYFQFQDVASTKLTIAQVVNELVDDEEATPGSTIYSLYGGYTLNGYAGNNTLVAFDGANTILFGAGYGNEYVSFNTTGSYYSPSPSENIIFGAGIGLTSIILYNDGSSGNITIKINGTSDSLTIENASWLISQSLLSFQFGDGTILNSSGINEMVSASSYSVLTWYASASNITLTGNDFAPNIFYTAPGNDTIIFGNGAFAGNFNEVDYGLGDGQVIIDPNGGPGTIQFGAGISEADLSFQSSNITDNLTITLLGSDGAVSGDSLTILDDLSPNYNSQLKYVEFADGTTLAINGSLENTWTGTSADTILTGSDYGANLFELGPGGDSVTFGNGSDGGSKQNIVDFGIGDGSASISLNGAIGTIVLGTGLTERDAIFESDNTTGNFTISLLGEGGTLTGDSLVVPGALYDYFGFNSFINSIVYNDGTTLPVNGNLTDTWIGSATNTYLVGSEWARNVFDLGPGGDQVTFGSGSEGGSNWNTVDYGIGDGTATINLNGHNGTIVLGAGITEAGVIFESDNTTGNLTLSLLGAGGTLTGDSLLVLGDFYDYFGLESHIGDVLFADGTSLPVNGNLTNTWIGSTTNTNLVGSEWARNVFELAPGGDHVTFGSGSEGGSNWNIVDYGVGDGAATINVNGHAGTIVLGPGITEGTVVFESDNITGNLTISLLGAGGTLTGDSLVVLGDLYDYFGLGSRIGNILFADGTTLPVNGNLTDTWIGSTTNTNLVGSEWASNVFELAPGGDRVTFGSGSEGGANENAVYYGVGDGAATINVNGHAGTIVLGNGIAQSNVIFESDNIHGNLTIALTGAAGILTGDDIVVLNDLLPNFYSYIGDVVIEGGTSATSISINAKLTNTWLGSLSTTLTGSDYGNNLFELAPGGDSVTFGNGAYDNAQGEINIVDYSIGDGAVTINPNGMYWNQGTIVFGAGITASDVIFQTDNNSSVANVTLSLLGAGGTLTCDSIRILSDVRAGDNATEVGDLVFADGTTLAVNGDHDVLCTWLGTSGTTLVGSDYGNNLFELAPGGDNVTFGNGAYNNGYGEINIVDYSTGDGAVTINPNGVGGTIQLGTGIVQNNLAFMSDASGDLKITVLNANGLSAGDSLLVLNDLSGTVGNQSSKISLELANGSNATIENEGSSGVSLYTATAGMAYLGSAASNVVVSNGAAEYVLSGGLAVSTQVLSGGAEIVYAGGTATSTSDIGGQVIVSGGTANGLTASNGGSYGVVVLSGGVLSGGNILSGTDANVSSGGITIGVTVTGAGATVTSGGVASNTVLISGSDLIVAGGVVVGTTIASGSLENLSAGAVASGSVISSGGAENVSSGGTASATTINSGGTQYVYSGGSAVGAIVRAGAYELVSSGGTISGVTIAGGTVNASSGATLTGNIVFAGSTGQLSLGGNPPSGAIVSGFVIGDQIDLTSIPYVSGAVASVNSSTDKLTLTEGGNTYQLQLTGSFTNLGFVAASDGISGTDITEISAAPSGVELYTPASGSSYLGTVASNVVVSNGATEFVFSAATALATQVLSGGTQIVYAGGTATSTSDVGGQIVVSGGTATGISVSNGGVNGVIVYSGGLASGGTILAGTDENISSGGQAVGVTVSGAALEVASGGVASNSVLASGSHLDVSGGTVMGTSVGIGSNENISAGATATGTVVNASGTENVLSGGTATSTTVNSGGTQAVSSGGTATSTSVGAGGVQTVYGGGTAISTSDIGGQLILSGGTASGLSVSNGGASGVVVLFGGVASGGTVLAGTSANISNGGRAIGLTVSGAGLEVTSGGTASNSVLVSGSHLDVSSGSVTGTSVGIGSTENLSAGAAASGTVVNASGTQNVLSGATATSTSVNSGGSQVIASGGSAAGGTVNSGGQQVVLNAGKVTSTTISAGGLETISSGGVASSISVSSGGFQTVLSGGSAVDAILIGAGQQTISNGGKATSTTVAGGGSEIVFAGGVASSTTVSSGGAQIIVSGGSAVGAVVIGSGQQVVSSGGAATATTVSTAGLETISAAGTASSTTVSSGGSQIILTGGSAIGAALSNGGQQIVSSGGLAVSTTISAGGSETISTAGTASSTTVSSGGSQIILTGGSAIGATLSTGGQQTVSSGGKATSTTVLGAASETISAAGVASSTTVSNGGVQTILADGSAVGAALYSGSIQAVSSGGTATSTIIGTGGVQDVYGGGTAISTSDVGGQIILSGGTASGLSVSNGGANGVLIYSGGVASGGTVLAGTNENVSSGGKAIGVTISAAGLEVTTGGVASNSILISGSHLDVSGGAVSGTSVGISSTENLSAGATAISSFVNSGGTQNVRSGGTASSATISSGGIQAISAGGSASLTSIKTGTETVYAGGTATSTSDIGGQIILSGGTAVGLTVSNGGVNGVLVYSGGIASGGTVLAGTNENISSGGRAIGVTVSGAGLEVTAGGVASNSVLVSGSHLDVTSGTVSGTSVGISSTENLSAGASASGSVVISGGTETVLSGAIATSTTVSSGGMQVVSSGGKVSGTTISGGGSEIVQSGATMSGSINFAGSNATLSIGGTVLPTNVISGFDAGGVTTDDIILTSYTYSSSDTATLGSGNVLTLHLNGTISTLHFNTAQSFAGEYFAVQKNSLNQVVIIDPPITASGGGAGAGIFDVRSDVADPDLSTALAILGGPNQMLFLPNSGSAAPDAGASGTNLFSLELQNQSNMRSFIPANLAIPEGVDPTKLPNSMPTSGHFAGGLDGEIINRSLQNGPQHGIFVHSGLG